MAQSHASNRDPNSATSCDLASWHALLAVHDRWLRTVALARLREREAADEVMQEVALAVVRRSAPVVDSTRIAPWLYRLLIQQIFLYRRKCGRRRKLTQRYQERVKIDEHDARSPDPAEWLLSAEQRADVRRALSTLPRKDAEILLLKYTEGWSYHQIAAHLGIGHSAVEARLHRARARMRTLLAETEIALKHR
jgi:RNA polymerase sigma factor (sigma-70 family)